MVYHRQARIILSATVLIVSASIYAQSDQSTKIFDFWNEWVDASKTQRSALVDDNQEIATLMANGLVIEGINKLNDRKPELAKTPLLLALEVYEQTGDSFGEGSVYQHLGYLHQQQRDCPSAIIKLGIASEKFHELGESEQLTQTANSLIRCIGDMAVPDRSLQEPAIANLRVGVDTQIFVYHPERCSEAGELVCKFYLLHKFAHVYLKHSLYNTPWEEGEIQADCWAAKHGLKQWSNAAAMWLLSANEANSPPQHKSNERRAERIKDCAYL